MCKQGVNNLTACREGINILNELFCGPLGKEVERLTGVNYIYSLFFGDEARCYAQSLIDGREEDPPEDSLSMKVDFKEGVDLEEAIEKVKGQVPYWWWRYNSSKPKMQREFMGLGVAIETETDKPKIMTVYVIGIFRDWY